MTTASLDGRRFVRELIARARPHEDGSIELFAPTPGLWRDGAPAGTTIEGGAPVGTLEVLGMLYRVRAPHDAVGVVVESRGGKRRARRPVDPSIALLRLDREIAVARAAHDAPTDPKASRAAGPVFKLPLGGRYYAQPTPGSPPFVKVGDELSGGETVALIEVMKTFNRVQYGGPGVPARARVTGIAAKDGDDVETGAVLLMLEALT